MVLNASTTKDYFIKVSGWQISDYSLNVVKNAVVEDDFTNSIDGFFDTKNTYRTNHADEKTLSGTLETSYDKDMFKFKIAPLERKYKITKTMEALVRKVDLFLIDRLTEMMIKESEKIGVKVIEFRQKNPLKEIYKFFSSKNHRD